MSYYKHFIFACLAAIGACAVSCSDDTFGTDNNNIDGRLHFRAKVIQNKQLTKGSRAAQPADACIEARNIQGPSFQGKTIWLQERTINGIFPSLKQRAATRGNIIPSVDYLSYLCGKVGGDNSLFLWGYRAKNKQDSYETWFGNQKLKIDDKGAGTFVNDGASENKYLWSADKPCCKFFALFGKDLDVSEGGEAAANFSYNNDENPAHFDFTCSEYVSEQFDLLAATKNVNYNQEKSGQVNLELCHALTAVQFSIGNLPKGYKLKEVELQNIKTEGTYTFPTADKPWGEWNLSDAIGNLSLDYETKLGDKNTIAVGINPFKNDDGSWNDENYDTFFVIPQKYENIKVYLLLGKANTEDPKDHRPDNIPIVIPLDNAKLDKDKREFSAGTTKIFNLSFDNSWNTFITKGPGGTIYVNADMVNFNVFSYSKKKSDITPEKWEYVGYEVNNGNIQEGNPKWLTVETTHGDGGYNVGNITIHNSERKTIFPWDDELVRAAQKGKKEEPYNLANKSGGKDIEETANCYVISAPGVYTIPLVYGNAIHKNGEKNSDAYTFKGIEPDDKEAASSILKKFVNAAGEAITSPYIEGAERAEMLWQDKHQEDKKDIVSNLQIKGIGKYHYLQFEVLKENIQSGNALVAVRNHDGKILWSWHLWFVPEEEYGGTAYYNGRNIAEYPLGYTPYTYGLDEDKQADRKVKLVFRQKGHPEVVSKFTVEQKYKTEHLFYMTYYQHGRKDPFSGDVVHAQNKIEAVNGKQSLAYGIQHPNELINFNITENWCEHKYFNLWSANATISDLNPYNNVKTIYDPCPVGYKVPPANTFDGMDNEGGICDEDKYGWTFNIMIKNKNKKGESENLFIPMTGNVMYDLKAQKPVSFLYYVKNGEFPYPMAEGFYQLATAVKSSDESHPSKTWLYLEHDRYTPIYKTQNVADADAVLPIKDE